MVHDVFPKRAAYEFLQQRVVLAKHAPGRTCLEIRGTLKEPFSHENLRKNDRTAELKF